MSRLATLSNFVSDHVRTLPVAFVYVTERCNSKCTGCDFWRHGTSDLPVDRAKELGRELEALGTDTVVLSGGEPLFHPRWTEVATALGGTGTTRKIWLLTAGLSLATELDAVTRLCERVTVSLDGATAETYRAVRGVDAFSRVANGIGALATGNRWVSLRVTVQRANFREIPALVRLARELGVRQISFFPVDIASAFAFGRTGVNGAGDLALDESDLRVLDGVVREVEASFATEIQSGFIAEDGDKLRNMQQYFSAILGKSPFPRVRCNAPRFSAVVRVDGHVQPCHFIPGARGSTLAESLDATRATRRDIRRGARSECQRCVCPMWKSPRELVRGR